VRGQRWTVSEVEAGERSTLVSLQSVENGRYDEALEVFWEIEPDRLLLLLPNGSLPEVNAAGFDPPERLAAFLDAVRWSAVTSADVKTLQAPFRSGVAIEDKFTTRRGHRATDLVTLLLKKRLFFSSAAFAHTIGVYSETRSEIE
jgi:hypothetical protein